TCLRLPLLSFFFFTHPATTEIYTLSLHDALPISEFPEIPMFLRFPLSGQPRRMPAALLLRRLSPLRPSQPPWALRQRQARILQTDRKSTRLNSSHVSISYAVFCLKKKKKNQTTTT